MILELVMKETKLNILLLRILLMLVNHHQDLRQQIIHYILIEYNVSMVILSIKPLLMCKL